MDISHCHLWVPAPDILGYQSPPSPGTSKASHSWYKPPIPGTSPPHHVVPVTTSLGMSLYPWVPVTSIAGHQLPHPWAPATTIPEYQSPHPWYQSPQSLDTSHLSRCMSLHPWIPINQLHHWYHPALSLGTSYLHP